MNNKIKIAALIITITFTSLLIFASCSGMRTYKAFIDRDKRIAVEAGDIYGDLSRDFFKARTQEHSSVDNMISALRNNYIDAILISDSFIRQLQGSDMYDEFRYIQVPEYVYINKAAHIFHTAELRDKYNEWFAGIVEDGTFEEILDRWLSGGLPAFSDIPVFNLTGENGTLRVCDTGNYPPLSYYDNNVLVGLDMEMTQRFAQYLGMDLDVIILDYEEIEDYVLSGRVDMSAATKAVTEERMETIIFGEPCLITEAVLIVKK